MTGFLSQTNITADEVYKMATGHPSTSFVGQLYLDLSRRLVAQGQLKEALLHAKKACDFYLKSSVQCGKSRHQMKDRITHQL